MWGAGAAAVPAMVGPRHQALRIDARRATSQGGAPYHPIAMRMYSGFEWET